MSTPFEGINDHRLPEPQRTHLMVRARSGDESGAAFIAEAICADAEFQNIPGVPDPKELARLALASATQLHDAEARIASDRSGLVEVDLAALVNTEPTPPQFIVDGWLPMGEVTLLGAHGGTGKSLLALHLAICVALGLPFFGIPTKARRVAVFTFEDPQAVVHWRIKHLCAAIGVGMAALAQHLRIIDGTNAAGVWFDRGGKAGDGFAGAAKLAEGSEFIVVDGAADTFGGDELKRAEVRAFVRLLRTMIPADGALLLTAHVDKAGAQAGASAEGYSGSTAWNNSVRSRLFMWRDKDSGITTLELRKSNWSEAGASIALNFDKERGVFAEVRKFGSSGNTDARELILSLIAQAAQRGDPVTSATTGRRTTHHVMSAMTGFPSALRDGPGKASFWRLLEELRQDGAVVEGVTPGPDRHDRKALFPSGAGNEAQAEVSRAAGNAEGGMGGEFPHDVSRVSRGFPHVSRSGFPQNGVAE